jgi:hypothetical protein
MTKNSSEPKPVGNLSHRALKRIGQIDPQSYNPNNKTEIELHSWKKQKLGKWRVYLDGKAGH